MVLVFGFGKLWAEISRPMVINILGSIGSRGARQVYLVGRSVSGIYILYMHFVLVEYTWVSHIIVFEFQKPGSMAHGFHLNRLWNCFFDVVDILYIYLYNIAYLGHLGFGVLQIAVMPSLGAWSGLWQWVNWAHGKLVL